MQRVIKICVDIKRKHKKATYMYDFYQSYTLDESYM